MMGTRRFFLTVAIGLVLLGSFAFTAAADGAALGKITLLRVHDVGTWIGVPGNGLDVEVVIQLDTAAGMVFGFQLRNDANMLTHQAMFALMLEAYIHRFSVRIDYLADPGSDYGRIVRAWISM